MSFNAGVSCSHAVVLSGVVWHAKICPHVLITTQTDVAAGRARTLFVSPLVSPGGVKVSKLVITPDKRGNY
jgi:hypothetical protein